jgi:hypothetical protein
MFYVLEARFSTIESTLARITVCFIYTNTIIQWNVWNSIMHMLSYRVHTVFNKGISIWNCLDEEIKNQKSYFSFKKKAKLNYLLI